MFNQQLFVCDWWHNVQCDAEISSQYRLNSQIYDDNGNQLINNWQSNRLQRSSDDQKHQSPSSSSLSPTTATTESASSNRINVRRMALHENLAMDSELNDSLQTEKPIAQKLSSSSSITTTIIPSMMEEQTTQLSSSSSTSSSPSKSKSILGYRRSTLMTHNDTEGSNRDNNGVVEEAKSNRSKSRNDSDDTESTDSNSPSTSNKSKRNFLDGTKGGRSKEQPLSRFSRIIQANKNRTPPTTTSSSSMNSGNRSSFSMATRSTISKHRFAHQSHTPKMTSMTTMMTTVADPQR